MVWVLATALLALLSAGLIDLVVGVRHATLRPVPYLLAAAASVLLVVVGAAGISGARIRLGLDSALGSVGTGLRCRPHCPSTGSPGCSW